MIIINGKEITINRANAVVSEMDEAYIRLVKQILDEGVQTHNRTGIDTIAIPGWNYKFNMANGFPIAETKKVNAKNLTNEIQWIHQVQSNEVKWLTDRDNNTWNLWVVDADGIYRVYEQGDNAKYDPERMVPLMEQVINPVTGVLEKIPKLDKYGKQIMVKSMDVMMGVDEPRTIKEAIWFGPEYAGTIGEAYGFINATYKKPQSVEWTIKNCPTDRRMQISLWQDAHIPKAVLPSCVWSSEYKVTPDGKLHSYVHQRSADVPLGLPFNISQYAVLLSMFAKATGLEAGTMSWSIMDAHIYVNQLEGIKKQVKRFEYMKEYSNIIQTSTDEDIETLYNKTVELFDRLHEKAITLIGDGIDKMSMSKRVEKIKADDEKNAEFADEYEEAFERKVSFEHMLTRETPELELADVDSIFEFSTDYVDKNDPYLKENPIGNKDIKLKKYHPTPFISMPIAQ